jgi:hypothetical protein
MSKELLRSVQSRNLAEGVRVIASDANPAEVKHALIQAAETLEAVADSLEVIHRVNTGHTPALT